MPSDISRRLRRSLSNLFDWSLLQLPRSIRARILRAMLPSACYPGHPGLSDLMDTTWSLRNLQAQGFSPARIVDCGAFTGTWSQTAKSLFPQAEILMIEANPEKETSLRAVQSQFPGSIQYAMTLLGPAARASVPYFQMETGSSVYEEQSNFSRNVLHLPMATLDDTIASHGFHGVELLKLDVQGFELEVLKGATSCLGQASIVLLEVSFLPYNKNAPLADEVVTFMSQQGFVIYDIGATTRWGRGNALLQADFIFVKREMKLRPAFF